MVCALSFSAELICLKTTDDSVEKPDDTTTTTPTPEVTTQATTAAATTIDDEPAKSGCKSAVSGVGIALSCALGATAITLKKRKEKDIKQKAIFNSFAFNDSCLACCNY